jgi:hypothetical protein
MLKQTIQKGGLIGSSVSLNEEEGIEGHRIKASSMLNVLVFFLY